MTEFAIPSRAPAPEPVEDAILPFEVASLDLRGRTVRLGPALDRILGAHVYPAPVAKLLGEAIVLTVLLGSSLKFEGRFILQTQTDGPVRMLVVDFTSDFTNPGRVRACARFDRARVEAAIAARAASPGELLGQGHLAMTIDQGADMSRSSRSTAPHIGVPTLVRGRTASTLTGSRSTSPPAPSPSTDGTST